MFLALLLSALGIAILIKGANLLVDGASALALRFKISPSMIGLTIVAFGTSAPELVVSITGAIEGKTDLILGNIIGSCIANILLILGLAAAIRPFTVKKNTVFKEIPMYFLSATIFTIMGLRGIIDKQLPFTYPFMHEDIVGTLTLSGGLILLSFFLVFLYYTFGLRRVVAPKPENLSNIKTLSVFKSLMLVIFGVVGLAGGSHILVDNAVIVATSIGVSDAFIGITLIAVGTSIPELATTVVSARKNQVDIAVGNVIGSNIFNLLFIVGTTSLLTSIPLRGEILQDIYMLFASTIVLFIVIFINTRYQLGRLEGFTMLLMYISYIAFLVIEH